MGRTYLTLTPGSAVISGLLIFFGAFLLGLWCGWMWWGRHLLQDARARRERLKDWAVVALFALVLALIFLGILALFESYLLGAAR
jgi:hypothetical protein